MVYPGTTKLTDEREFFNIVFGDNLPEVEVSLSLNDAPEEHPVKVGEMVHDKHTTSLELTTITKRPCPDSKQTL